MRSAQFLSSKKSYIFVRGLSNIAIQSIDASYHAREYGCIAMEVSCFDKIELTYRELVDFIDNSSVEVRLLRRSRFEEFLADVCDECAVFILSSTYLGWRYNFRSPRSLRQKKTSARAYRKKYSRRLIFRLDGHRDKLSRISVNLTERCSGRLLLPDRGVMFVGHDDFRITVVARDYSCMPWLRVLASKHGLFLHLW